MISDNNSLIASIFQLNDEKIEKFSFRNKNEIDKASEDVKSKKFNISDISTKVVNRNPSGPFTTSTLQQTASGRLGFWCVKNNANCSKTIPRY